MQNLPGYEFEELLHTSNQTSVWRATRTSDGRGVVVKCPRADTSSSRLLTRYRNEFEILRSLECSSVVRAIDLLRHDSSLALILERLEGCTLSQWVQADDPGLEERLEAAISLTASIGEIHAAGIIHKDINSRNAIIDAATRKTKLIDFGISSRLRTEGSEFQAPSAIEGTLAYIAPEQTGRMNHSIDQRADLYSLGVTIYELLSGHLPHTSEDPLECVHFHIAGKAIALNELDADIPEPLAGIVTRLLHKAPEDRYQSAIGLEADLTRCLTQLRHSGTIESFEPGSNDQINRFELSQRLYGRKKEIAELVSTFERTASGTVESIVVSGSAGVGKTSLVRELYAPVTRRRGYFAAGKFDQLRQSAPFSALVEALQGLVAQLLTDSEEQLEYWRERIRASTGRNGQLLVDVIPNLELIIGKQEVVPELPGTEARNRFSHVFRNFVHAIARRQHPLVIFLDDVQWADSASLDLINLLLTTPDSESLLIVQSYREGDAADSHKFEFSAKTLEEYGVYVGRIELKPLGTGAICKLVADTLHRPPADIRTFASVVESKAGGNPFFIGQFLKSLYTDESIAFNSTKRSFDFNLDAATHAEITDNVAELLTQRLAALPDSTIQALKIAATIGRNFNVRTVALLLEEPEAATARRLDDAVAAEVVVPTSKLESLDNEGFDAPLGFRQMRFLHDRLQKAAYDLIEPDARAQTHLAIGRAELRRIGSDAMSRDIFDVLDHMNRGKALLTDTHEMLCVAELNADAGARARNSTAYSLAVSCYRHSLDLLGGPDAWIKHPQLTLTLHMKLAEALSLDAQHNDALEVISEAMEFAEQRVDRTKLFALKVGTHLGMGDTPATLKTGREALQALDVELPTDEAAIDHELHKQIGAILAKTSESGFAALLELPEMEAPEEIAFMALLAECLPAAYQSDQKLFALICCRMVLQSMTKGNCPLSARAYGSFGALLGSAMNDLESAYQFTQLAINLTSRLNSPAVLSAAQFLHAMFASHWKEPIEMGIAMYTKCVANGLEHGDHVHATFGAARRIMTLQFSGMHLDQVHQEALAASELIRGLGDLPNVAFLEPRMRFMEWLQKGSGECTGLGTPGRSEQTLAREIRTRGNMSFESDWYMLLVQQRYFAGEYEQALEYSREAEKIQSFSAGLLSQAEHGFFCALTAAAMYDDSQADLRSELKSRLDARSAELDNWAQRCPENFRPLALLVKAEQARVNDDTLAAMNYFDDAIVSAAGNGFIHIEALASELAANYWHKKGKPHFRDAYFTKAVDAYESWGATGKAAMLRESHGLAPVRHRRQTVSASTTLNKKTDYGDALDLATALKASQALSGEIRLDKLVAQMMNIILENVGGERIALVLGTDVEFFVQGVKDSIDGDARVMLDEPLAATTSLSRGIANYVIRTSSHVVLTNPAIKGTFRNDSYVCARKPKSVLCAPIIYKGKLSGLVYLENNQVAGAFTPDRLEALNLLMSQVSVSIENATLYARQKQQAQSIERANAELAAEVGERKAAEQELSQYKNHLEDLVRQRTSELENAQGRLVELSRRSGMAEVSAGVLHNVGNVMNSINVGAHVVRNAVRELNVEKIESVCNQLDLNKERLGEFLRDDPAGRKIPIYLRKLGDVLADQKQEVSAEIVKLMDHLDHMKRVIAAQQTYAKTGGVDEICSVDDIVDTALAISEAALRSQGVEVAMHGERMPPALLDRHQILQVLINLISNSRHAVEGNPEHDRRIDITVSQSADTFLIEVADNGTGIPVENLSRIFNHGFTTKKDGHGFGLHNCANTAHDMGGSLEVSSDGEGKGSRFTLSVPARKPQEANTATEVA